VDVYGSFLNPYPNSAFNEFKARSIAAQQDAIIYVKVTKLLMIAIIYVKVTKLLMNYVKITTLLMSYVKVTKLLMSYVKVTKLLMSA
jgi:hypothetical protein